MWEEWRNLSHTGHWQDERTKSIQSVLRDDENAEDRVPWLHVVSVETETSGIYFRDAEF